MKIASALIAKETVFGVVADGVLTDLRHSFIDVVDLLLSSRTPEGRKVIAEAAWGAPTYRLDRAEFLPPIEFPEHILCVGANYRDRVAESSFVAEAPAHPLVFTRFNSSFVGHGQPIERPPVSSAFDYEGELAVIVGATVRRADQEAAVDAVAGYSCLMDGTIRDFQRHTSQFTAGKNFDRSGSWGPWIVTADEIASPADLGLRTTLDGEVVQSATTASLIFDIGAIVSYCSMFTTLRPGDVIATGTPAGVGEARTPQRWLEAGSSVSVEIDGVGRLENPVINAT